MHQETSSLVLPGQIDVWSLDLLEESGRLQCSNIRSWLYYLASEQTYGACVDKSWPQTRYADVTIFGPRCDDGGRLYVQYGVSRARVSADSTGIRLSPEEINILRDKLKEHVRITDEEFPHKGLADARKLCQTLGLPYVR